MKLTYAITVSSEEREFRKLYETLRINKHSEDNIIVLVDMNKYVESLNMFLDILNLNGDITLIRDNFQGNFADWKNKLRNHPKVDGDYICFLDADELLPPQLIDDLPLILELNPDVDVFGLPRANYVKGITEEDIQKWGWRIDEQQRINWCDYQYRICKNKPEIQWVGKIHETLGGYKLRVEPSELIEYIIKNNLLELNHVK